MVWGSFAGSRVGDLHRVTGSLDQNGYHSILQSHAVPSGLCLVGQGFILQQDNDPKHTFRLSELPQKKITRKQASNHGTSTVSKLVWDELYRRVKAKQPAGATYLTSATVLGRTFPTIFNFHCRKNVCSFGGYFDELKIQIKFCLKDSISE